MALKYFSASSPAMQRASIEAAAALMSSGNSRNTKRTLPVSIYFDLSIGKTFCSKRRAMRAGHRRVFDDGHRSLGGPERHVGQRHRFCQQCRTALCAMASPTRGCGTKPANAASPASDRAMSEARGGS